MLESGKWIRSRNRQNLMAVIHSYKKDIALWDFNYLRYNLANEKELETA